MCDCNVCVILFWMLIFPIHCRHMFHRLCELYLRPRISTGALQASDAQIALKARSSGGGLADVIAQAQCRAKVPEKSGGRALGWNLFGKCMQLASKSRKQPSENTRELITS